ncbi:MAG: nucleotidyltransferase family protein [Planctomycetes bacterium]|nr:nucleotidyltransferase family protein [Planctomycetota bacterium]
MSTQARSIGRVLTRVRRHLPELRERYQVKSLGIFGSYVRGTQNRRSDIDVLVEFHQAPTLFEFVRLQTQLSRITGAKVDLVMKSALKPAIGRRVLEEVLYL